MAHTIHAEVVARHNEPLERLIKRFLKKCKKEKIFETIKEKTYFKKPSEIKRAARLARTTTLRKLYLAEHNISKHDSIYKRYIKQGKLTNG